MRYDVFLSFIGEDIRRTFLSHLLQSFDKKGITSVTSAASSPTDEEVIKWSLVVVYVISKNYTSLDLWVEELARLIECHEKVVPVILRVDLLDVLTVISLAQDSVYEHGTRWYAFGKVKNWLDGHVASQSCFNSSDWEDESQLVEQITLVISNTVTQDSSRHWFPMLPWLTSPFEESHSLGTTSGSYSGIHRSFLLPYTTASWSPLLSSSHWTPFWHSSNPSETMSHSSNPSETVVKSSWWDKVSRRIPFVNRSNHSETIIEEDTIEEARSGPRRGMNHLIEEVLSMLQLGDSTEEVRTVGICGIEGVGKTTLATCVYEEISSEFQYHFFMSNFSQNGNSLLEILASETTNFNESAEVIKEMVGRKVLLVADSVADIKQLKSLAKEVSLFGPGSRVIVITQYRSLLFQCGVKHIYEVGCPGYDNAIQLFSHFAFRQTIPLTGFERLSGRAVEVAGRIPLALKLLGSYLHGRGQDEWESTLGKLEKAHNDYTTEEVLKYIGADDSARRTRTIVELEENEENRFPSYFFTLE